MNFKCFSNLVLYSYAHLQEWEIKEIDFPVLILGFPKSLDFYDLVTVFLLWQGGGELLFCSH